MTEQASKFDRKRDAYGRDVLPDGIYFGLPNEEYHADPALGSGNLRDLLQGGPTYWWNSGLNPNRKRKATRALDFGSAMHAMVLEGKAEFDRQYACVPDPEGALVTYADAVQFLKDRHEAKIPRAKADAMAQVRMIAPEQRIYDLEIEAIAASGRTKLSLDDYARIQVASAMITRNPELRHSFTGGIPEVSVFWTRNGTRVKCRFDYLRPQVVADLKTLGNTMGKPFPVACRETIARRELLVQAALYLEGRYQISTCRMDTFGDNPDARLWTRIAQAPEWAWAWVFIQSVEAPITWASSLSTSNPALDYPRMQITNAVNVYEQFMSTFGTNEMWLLAEPVTELDQSELPGWYGYRD